MPLGARSGNVMFPSFIELEFIVRLGARSTVWRYRLSHERKFDKVVGKFFNSFADNSV